MVSVPFGDSIYLNVAMALNGEKFSTVSVPFGDSIYLNDTIQSTVRKVLFLVSVPFGDSIYLNIDWNFYK